MLIEGLSGEGSRAHNHNDIHRNKKFFCSSQRSLQIRKFQLLLLAANEAFLEPGNTVKNQMTTSSLT